MVKDVQDTIMPYFATKKELLAELHRYTIDQYPTGNIIAFYDTDDLIGLFKKSDVIIQYNDKDEPIMVTERLYERDCVERYWDKTIETLQAKLNNVNTELGFNVSISIDKDYIDYIHYKKEWYLCK